MARIGRPRAAAAGPRGHDAGRDDPDADPGRAAGARPAAPAGGLAGPERRTAAAGARAAADATAGAAAQAQEPRDAIEIAFGGASLLLLADHAAFDAASRTVLVADVHIGKAASFRRLGVPVPAGTTDSTLARLTRLVDRHAAARVVFLGDFLHSAHALAPATLAALTRWRARHPDLELTLVRGNHDDRAGDPPAALGIRAVDEPLVKGGVAWCHHPRPRPGLAVLAGHLHPCVGVGARARDRHRLPCFWFSDRVGVLPAFGAFTGMHPIRRRPGERVFATAGGRVFEVGAFDRASAQPPVGRADRAGARP